MYQMMSRSTDMFLCGGGLPISTPPARKPRTAPHKRPAGAAGTAPANGGPPSPAAGRPSGAAAPAVPGRRQDAGNTRPGTKIATAAAIGITYYQYQKQCFNADRGYNDYPEPERYNPDRLIEKEQEKDMEREVERER